MMSERLVARPPTDSRGLLVRRFGAAFTGVAFTFHGSTLCSRRRLRRRTPRLTVREESLPAVMPDGAHGISAAPSVFSRAEERV